jgi:DNA-binding CsgD family transcriptional regulator
MQLTPHRGFIMEMTIERGAWKGHLGLGLAPRELECMLWVAQGMTGKEIARLFGVAPITVAKRIESAMFKLGVHRRAALVAEAMRRQIITPMCLLLASVIAMHAMLDDGDPMRRDRRAPERRTVEVRSMRKVEGYEYIV